MTTLFAMLCSTGLLIGACAADGRSPHAPTRAMGPVLPGRCADPHVARVGTSYWIYPTTDGQQWMSTSFRAYRSDDLRTWTDEGVVLDLAEVSWAESRAWAPAMVEKDGRFYFYFTAEHRIGVAVGEGPGGPFRDALGEPLVEDGIWDTFEIDPYVFTDDDGRNYLYFGNGRCLAVELGDDMISFDHGAVRDVTPRDPTTEFREGVCVFRRGDVYHMTWSVNDTRSPDYQVHAATATSPFGPFEVAPNNPILFRDGVSLGTAHHSVVQLADEHGAPTDDWVIVFHRFAVPGGDGMNREVCLAPLTFAPDGTIERVDLSALRE
ncbi:MAG: family 43 glycosylhydrolase [Phycisphaerales bacterium]|nr:family 43 glycosylhydrolase [Phycisphaerales bacterium]